MKITNYIKAGFPALFVVTHEEARAQASIAAECRKADAKLYAWTFTRGLFNTADGKAFEGTNDPLVALDEIAKLNPGSVILLCDFHAFMGNDASPMLVRKMKDAFVSCKNCGSESDEGGTNTIVVCGAELRIPVELAKEFTVIEFALPDRDTIREIVNAFANTNGEKLPKELDTLVQAACGLTTNEIENALALAVVETGGLTKAEAVAVIQREKVSAVKKNGLLEIVESNVTLEDIGGLDLLKAELFSKRNLFTKQAREYGLPTPRGILNVGQPGTGKSLTASATKSVFGIPLLRLEAGRIFGSLVGESERNWRTAFATAKAISPCVLWIDEVDGLFAGAQSSGKTDGGTTARVIKAILQDMQMNGEGIFFMFTANDVDGLPDPLIDRLDVWSVDLPTHKEREQIVRVHIGKRNRDAAKFNTGKIADATEGFSGRQIEQVWLKAMTTAFNANLREPTTEDVIAAAKSVVPTSKLMAAQITARRERLKDRAQPASSPEGEAAKTDAPGTRKLKK